MKTKNSKKREGFTRTELLLLAEAKQRGLEIPAAIRNKLRESKQKKSKQRILEARTGILAFTKYTMFSFVENWHHFVVAWYLDQFIERKIKRLMLFMPPRHSKSEFTSRRLPAYIFGKYPDASIMLCSYSEALATKMSNDAQKIMDSPEYNVLFPETKLAGQGHSGKALRQSDYFEILGRKGVYRCAGVSGSITGMGFDYGIIDDPVKNRKEAESDTVQKSVLDWYKSDFYTRQEGDASILLTLTRWNKKDLAGQILKENAGEWTVVTLPAIAEKKREVYDNRKEGEPLWEKKFNIKTLHTIKTTLGSYQWQSLYQQSPISKEGNLLKRAWWKYKEAIPEKPKRVVRYWDKAGTEGEGKFSAGVLLAKCGISYYIIEITLGRWSAYNREKMIKQKAKDDDTRFGRVLTVIEQEPGSGGKESAESTIRNLAGHWVKADKVTASKDTRLYPMAAQVEAGNFYLINDDWNEDFIDQAADVPNGEFRDMIDSACGAFNFIRTGSGINI